MRELHVKRELQPWKRSLVCAFFLGLLLALCSLLLALYPEGSSNDFHNVIGALVLPPMFVAAATTLLGIGIFSAGQSLFSSTASDRYLAIIGLLIHGGLLAAACYSPHWNLIKAVAAFFV